MTSETKVVIGVLIGCAVLIGLGGYFYAAKTVSPVENTPIANANRLERDGAYEIKATGEEKLKVVEFADFQCPACGVAYPVMKKLQKELLINIWNNYISALFQRSDPAMQV